jgi:hypothetical protein
MCPVLSTDIVEIDLSSSINGKGILIVVLSSGDKAKICVEL